jgi:hypothetical protein
MNFLRRKARFEKSATAAYTQGTVRREIEIHVEREWVSVTGQQQPAGAPGSADPCPLCGHHLTSTTTFLHGVLADGHPAIHGSCPGVIEPETLATKLTEFEPSATKMELL